MTVIYGINVGKNFYCEGAPRLGLKGTPGNIKIGNNVRILGRIDIRNRESGKLIIGDDVTIEENCRFVTARGGTISIGSGSVVGAYAIWNGGDDITVGKKCLFAWRSSINANDHLMSRRKYIRDQEFVHEPVVIEDDCWFGVNVSVNKGVTVKRGSVVGAGSVLTRDTEEYSVNVGVPAKQISKRVDA